LAEAEEEEVASEGGEMATVAGSAEVEAAMEGWAEAAMGSVAGWEAVEAEAKDLEVAGSATAAG